MKQQKSDHWQTFCTGPRKQDCLKKLWVLFFGKIRERIIDLSFDHGVSKEPRNPFPEWIQRFPRFTVMLNQCSVFGFSQRNALFMWWHTMSKNVKYALNTKPKPYSLGVFFNRRSFWDKINKALRKSLRPSQLSLTRSEYLIMKNELTCSGEHTLLEQKNLIWFCIRNTNWNERNAAPLGYPSIEEITCCLI